MIIETIILVIALSIDTLVASFGYGTNKIKIPFWSGLIITAICTVTLVISLILGGLLRPLIQPEFIRVLSFLILCILGVIKLFDSTIKSIIRRHKDLQKQVKFKISQLKFILYVYADPSEADANHSKELSATEAITLAIALSIDGLASGIGVAIANTNYLFVILLSIGMHFMVIYLGSYIGKMVMKTSNLNLDWLSGLLLIVLAILKLV